MGSPSASTQGKEAMIEKGDSYEIKEIPVVLSENNQESDSIFAKIKNDNLEAIGKLTFIGYNYNFIRARTINIFEEKKRNEFLTNYLERGNNKYLVNKSVEKLDDEKGILSFEYNFSIGNYITRSEDKIFVNMNIFKGMLSEKIKIDRDHLLRFYMKNSYKYYLELQIPEEFSVEHIPNNVSFENEFYKIEIKYSQINNNLIYEFSSEYNTLQLNNNEISKYNDFLECLYLNFREVVILQKDK